MSTHEPNDTDDAVINYEREGSSDATARGVSSDMGGQDYNWHRQTVKETFERIQADPTHPWLAIGDFLDDWRFTEVADRPDLVRESIAAVEGEDVELQRWAAFCAAMVEWLCWQDELPFPVWTSNPAYWLPEPWFLYPGDLLRAWQLTTTPAPFKMRNIFGGDQLLSRV